MMIVKGRNKIDISVPRNGYWSNEIKNKQLCPKCNSKLEKEYQTYLVIKKSKSKEEHFITGNDGGYFCPKCPVIVLDYEYFLRGVFATDMSTRSFEFIVPGIINTAAIPPDKSHLPLGDYDNPVPLVQFVHPSKKGNLKKKNRSEKKRKAKKQ